MQKCDLLSTKEAAAFLGVSTKFLYRNRTAFPPTHMIGARFRYSVKSLESWVRKARVKRTLWA